MAVRRPAAGDSTLQAALGMINTNRSGAVAGIQALGSAQDSNIGQIYGTLRGGLQEGVGQTQQIYNRGGQNVRNAYDMGGQQAAATHMGSAANISDNASRLGMDQRAVDEVQSKLATQAGLFAGRNAQSSRERSATIAQQGTGMTAVAQMAVEAARHAEARGKSDLSKRILAEVAKANTTAMTATAGASTDAANRSSERASRATSETASMQRQLISEQRAAAREARADARASKGKEVDPLDQMIKALKIKSMEAGLDPDSPQNALRGMKIEDILADRERGQGESADEVWADIYNRFPNHGKRTIPLLQDAIQAASTAKDESGMVARQHIQSKGGNLDLQVVLDQLKRLEAASDRANYR